MIPSQMFFLSVYLIAKPQDRTSFEKDLGPGILDLTCSWQYNLASHIFNHTNFQAL